jgi:AcrR family transcriptional regulator
MNDVSSSGVEGPYEVTGRTAQKRRTRAVLVSAARELIADGDTAPTVGDAAAAAGISRTTAYRYFPSQRALLIAAHPETETTSLLTGSESDDVAERVETVVRRFLEIIVDTEAQQRTMLRLSLTPGAEGAPLPLRQGRAIGWLSEALAPLTPGLGDDGVRRLAVAIRAVSGIESLVWLLDVARLDADQAVEQMVWSARALVERARTEGLPPPGR